MKTLVRHTISLAILGGLISALAAIVFLPNIAADAEHLALLLGALAVYALGAMAMVEYNRTRAVALRRTRARSRVAGSVVVPMPSRRHRDERIAA